MTPEIKQALEVIRDECWKNGWCDRRCELFNTRYELGNGERLCLISQRIPDEWNIEVWEDENDG